jgi:uncharacterized protein YjbI with pentapeptide repeats
MTGVVMTNASAQDANFTGATLAYAKAANADLSGAR